MTGVLLLRNSTSPEALAKRLLLCEVEAACFRFTTERDVLVGVAIPSLFIVASEWQALHPNSPSARRCFSAYANYLNLYLVRVVCDPARYLGASAVLGIFLDKFGRRPTIADAPDLSSIAESALKDNDLPVDFLGGAEGVATVCRTAMAEVSPVCAILGGILGQEVRVRARPLGSPEGVI